MAIFGNFKGTTQSEFKIGKSSNGSKISSGTQPSSDLTNGDLYIDSSNSTLQVYNNAWVSVGSTLTDLNVDNGTLYVDSSNDTVSVGSTTSNDKLFVNGSLRLGTNPSLKHSGAYLDVSHTNGSATQLRLRDNENSGNDPIFKIYDANNTSEVFKVQGRTVTFTDQEFTNSNIMKFNQMYTGASTGSYFTNGEYQKVVTIIPDGNSQNYQVVGRIVAQNAGETHTVYFNAALRSNTLPDLNWTILYDEEYNGNRYIDPQLWTKETSTAGFIFAFKTLATIYGTVTCDFEVIPRNSSQKTNVTVNTTQNSEQASVDADYTANDMTKVFSKKGQEFTIADAYKFPTTDGSANQVLTTDGSGTLSFTTVSATPAGSNTEIQFNDGGSFGSTDAFTFDKATNTLETGIVRGVIFEPILDYGSITETANMTIDYGAVTDSASKGDFEYLSDIYGPTGDTFKVSGLPSAAQPGQMIYVSDETGGATMAFSDGTNWRRITDRAVVS